MAEEPKEAMSVKKILTDLYGKLDYLESVLIYSTTIGERMKQSYESARKADGLESSIATRKLHRQYSIHVDNSKHLAEAVEALKLSISHIELIRQGDPIDLPTQIAGNSARSNLRR